MGFGRLHSQLLKEERTAHSSILVWEIPWTEDSGGLQSMGSQDLTSKVSPSFSGSSHLLLLVWVEQIEGDKADRKKIGGGRLALFRSDLAGPKPIQASTQGLNPGMLGSVTLAQTGPWPSAVAPGAPAARQLPHGRTSWSHVLQKLQLSC